MTDYATEENGARIALATSSDSRHPPENVLSSKENCFWTTTGMFPQEITITLKGKLEVTKIKLSTTSVKKVIVERTEGPQPSKFEKLFEVELQDKGNRMQTESHQVGNIPAKHLKLILVSGWDDFAAVHKVIVEGVPIKSSKDKDASGGGANSSGKEPAEASASTPKPSSSARSSSTERRERTSELRSSAGADASTKDEARAAPSPRPVRVPSARLGRSTSRGDKEMRDVPVEVRTPKGPAPGTPTKELRPPPERREREDSRERRVPSEREERAGSSERGRERSSRGSRKEKEEAEGEEDDEFNF